MIDGSVPCRDTEIAFQRFAMKLIRMFPDGDEHICRQFLNIALGQCVIPRISDNLRDIGAVLPDKLFECVFILRFEPSDECIVIHHRHLLSSAYMYTVDGQKVT